MPAIGQRRSTPLLFEIQRVSIADTCAIVDRRSRQRRFAARAHRSGRRSTRDALGLGTAPRGYFPMIAGEQNVGNAVTLPFLRPRVLRVLQKPCLEALVTKGCGGAYHSRQEPHARVDQHHRGKFAA